MSQDSPIARRQVVILNALGLHFRPAQKFMLEAQRFQSEIRVRLDGRESDGKSIIDMTMLAAECGARLDLEARGDDAEKAVKALAELVEARFHEDDEGQPVVSRDHKDSES